MSGSVRSRRLALPAGAFLGASALMVTGGALLTLLLGVGAVAPGCGAGPGGLTGGVTLGPPGSGQVVGATEYGGPGDPGSGVTGARGDNLVQHPDSYAELGGLTWQSATAMGGLPYMAALRITWGAESTIAYKRDFGLGGGPVEGRARAIDLWWQLARRLRIPYENGLWSGAVRVERPPETGAGSLLGQTGSADGAGRSAAIANLGCAPAVTGLSLTAGPRAALLSDGRAAAPAGAPPAVKDIIAAGNQIAGRPYVYGAAHGLPLAEVAPAYDCSSSIEHLLYGARLLPLTYGAGSGELESFGLPGPGRWVTLYANADHVFMYVGGLRWDTHDAAGPGDGSGGIGWHPLVRSAAGFVARHPPGL